MTGDFSRSTFRSTNHYSQVRMQQGRGVLDADLNEQADIDDHVQRRTTTDVVGASGAPFHPPKTFQNFQIKVDSAGKDLLIAPGRFYVDGILCEHEAAVTFLTQADFPGVAASKAGGSTPCSSTYGSGTSPRASSAATDSPSCANRRWVAPTRRRACAWSGRSRP